MKKIEAPQDWQLPKEIRNSLYQWVADQGFGEIKGMSPWEEGVLFLGENHVFEIELEEGGVWVRYHDKEVFKLGIHSIEDLRAAEREKFIPLPEAPDWAAFIIQINVEDLESGALPKKLDIFPS